MKTPSVLVFAGLDPGGGAGLAADVLALAAQGAHALPVATALTVQDNNRVHALAPVDAGFVLRQAEALIGVCEIRAVKLGIPGSGENARVIASLLRRLRERDPALPIVLDPVLASGAGDALGAGDPVESLSELLALATVALPNEPEFCGIGDFPCPHLLITGGHGEGRFVINRWYRDGEPVRRWRWPRLPGQFHGSGCTLASALAGRLALGEDMAEALGRAQAYSHAALAQSFDIAPGQRIPRRVLQLTA